MELNKQTSFLSTKIIAQTSEIPPLPTDSGGSQKWPIQTDTYGIIAFCFLLLAAFAIYWGTSKTKTENPQKLILITVIVAIAGTLALMFGTNKENSQQANACVTLIGTALGYAVGTSQNKSANFDDKDDNK
ncbi:hypothetical protein [Planktothrix agardhii]|jgi:FtsH-binding integral membrane protein|uniref:hypothetical protein n=1 Tax=Planktothrix agardhii TaxID=1160 RepID=UPI0020A7E908|nr:hypothetical protein [Planktothrix agardhii]CAD5985306.1 hypothetical protein NO365_04490 [Planktothrix agardhii]